MIKATNRLVNVLADPLETESEAKEGWRWEA